MNNNNKTYSREEKINYYTRILESHVRKAKRCVERLAYLQSEHYQDWDGDLMKDLERAKATLNKNKGSS